MVNYTPNLRLTQPDFDQTPWDEQINDDLSILDTAYGAFIAINGLSGVWQNSVAYLVGQSVVDATNSSVWKCNVAHTSAVAPTTFAQDRTANPTYWTNIVTGIVYLPITGGTLSGALGFTAPVGTPNEIIGYTGSQGRWLLALGDGVAETGGNTGSHFAIARYNDAGALVDAPMSISRTTGITTVIDITSNGSFRHGPSGSSLSATTNTTTFVQDSNLWRWEYTRTGGALGTLQYIRGSDSLPLFSIDNNGNTSILGSIAAVNIAVTAAISGSSVHSTGSVTSDTGTYFFGSPANSLIRGTDQYWRIGENNTVIFALSPTGTLALPNNITLRSGLSSFGYGGAGVTLQFAPSWYFDWASAGGTLRWTTSSGSVMSIDGTGNFAVNGRVTCNDVQNSSGAFYVAGTSIHYFARSTVDASWHWVENNINTMTLSPSGDLAARATITAGTDIIATGTGRKPGGGSWDVPSDLRLKQNVVDYTSGLAIINQLQPIEFSYAPETGFDTTLRHIGLAAQDIQDIMPNAVKSVLVADMPEASRDLTKSVDDVLVVNHNELLFALVNAVKELQARIVELENVP